MYNYFPYIIIILVTYDIFFITHYNNGITQKLQF